MNWTDFDKAEELILGNAPAAHRGLYEVKLRIAREKLAAGIDVQPELDALRRDVAGDARSTSRRIQ